MKNLKKKSYQYQGGKVIRNEYIYVERKQDNEIFHDISEDYSSIYLTGPRQIGKTSLAGGIKNRLKKKNWLVSEVDLRTYRKTEDEHKWCLYVMKEVIDELELDAKKIGLETWFNENQQKGFTEVWKKFFSSFIRKYVENPILFIFDELDTLQVLKSMSDDFLESIQLVFDKRYELKISFLLISIVYPRYLLEDLEPSSFKAGKSINLPDFSSEDDVIIDWCQGLYIDDELTKFTIGKEIFSFTGGIPFLNTNIFNKFNEEKKQSVEGVRDIVSQLIKEYNTPKDEDTISTHLESPGDIIKRFEGRSYTALDVYKKILNEPIPIHNKTIENILIISGLVKTIDNQLLDVRCKIYKEIFDIDWCKKIQAELGEREDKPLKKDRKPSKDLPHICIINIGGTIGMHEVEGKMRSLQNQNDFLSLYPGISKMAQIKMLHINPSDGANIFPEHWVKIAEAIKNAHDNYTGFVVAHGTDTMVYTASAVSFLLESFLKKPVVFVGSQAPHHVMHGDALLNVYRAVKIACEKIPEVVICFNDLVFRATRAEKKDDYRFFGFHSPTFPPLAVIAEEIEILRDNLFTKPNGEKKENLLIDDTEFLNEFINTKILKISQYPGLQPQWYFSHIDNNEISGIIIETLGLGNLPTTNDSYNFLPLIEKAKSKKIPVVITSRYPIKPEFMDKYLPASEPIQKGALSAGNMTSAAAVTKLMWIIPQINRMLQNKTIKLDQKNIKIQEMLAHNYVGEVDHFPEFLLANLIVS